MKKIFFITSMLIVQLGFAQLTIKKSSIDSGGQIAQVGTTSMISTIGEVVVQENTQTNIHISEGFISPEMLSSLSIDNYTTLEGISIYPNPTVDFVNIEAVNAGNLNITLFDLNGRILLYKRFISSDSKQINMKPYTAGTYMLVVKNIVTQQYKAYKIIKK
ncbi:MAG: T9SS type A sorting domain-containing protein [Bacteroidales bacterium]|nr:T9SS type A sorting domain-containing protein [Bacteroidales bacterium]